MPNFKLQNIIDANFYAGPGIVFGGGGFRLVVEDQDSGNVFQIDYIGEGVGYGISAIGKYFDKLLENEAAGKTTAAVADGIFGAIFTTANIGISHEIYYGKIQPVMGTELEIADLTDQLTVGNIALEASFVGGSAYGLLFSNTSNPRMGYCVASSVGMGLASAKGTIAVYNQVGFKQLNTADDTVHIDR